jgi:hypothetical protein
MWLNFSNCDAEWSYGGFHRFRKRIAEKIGVNLDVMDGFGGHPLSESIGSISWDTVEDEIKLFLNHSDCDGDLSPEECSKIIPRLEFLISEFESTDYDKINAIKLIDCMKGCVANGESLIFM